jgi:hypothetical protein
MAVYVDNAFIPYGRMKMSHLWADTEIELLKMVDKIGVSRRWIQKPPKASWVHFDIAMSKRELAIKYGAIPMDKFAPAEFVARQRGNKRMLKLVKRSRKLRGLRKDGQLT